METYGKWFESDISIVEIDGELYALAENNGEHYYGWKCIDRWTADPDGKEYTITPVCDWSAWNEEAGEFQDADGNAIDGIIGFEVTA